MPSSPVRLALLWHMHQPYYLDPETGESVLPWVRLHALKDYWGMVALVDECPGMRATFNLVPSLVEQVQAMREKHGIYFAGSGRINVAGLTMGNIDQFIAAVADVTG